MNYTEAMRRLYACIVNRIGSGSRGAKLFGQYVRKVLPKREAQYGLNEAPFNLDDAAEAFEVLANQCGSPTSMERGLDAERTLTRIADKLVEIARTQSRLEENLSDADRTFVLFGTFLQFYTRMQIDELARQDPVIAVLEAMQQLGLKPPSVN